MSSHISKITIALAIAGALLFAGGSRVSAVAPALREQLSLNGEWPVGGTVPTYLGIPNFDTTTYERDVQVPSDWVDRTVKVEFGAVNFLADVFANGRLLTNHVGGWNPFVVDVTAMAKPGGMFRLKVVAKGPTHQPIVNAQGAVAWPVGGWKSRGGIADDVWLRAYGPVYIEDAFIQTSIRSHTLQVDYTLRNTSAQSRMVRLEGFTCLQGTRGELGQKLNQTEIKRLDQDGIELGPREMKVVRLVAAWPDPQLYWPVDPAL
jgi:beta-galactosidase/beta-glucuronidase